MFQRTAHRDISVKPVDWLGKPDAAKKRAPIALRKVNERAEVYKRAAAVIRQSQPVITDLLGQARMGQQLDRSKIAAVVESVQASVAESRTALISLTRIRHKDQFTYMHSLAVCALMVTLGRAMDVPESSLEELGVAGLLHDVGKMMVPETILMKPGPLTADEMNVMRSHAAQGHELLAHAGNLPQVALEVCFSHHEKMDGSGYPQNLRGEQISFAARMGAICDVYDAMSAERPYKEAWTPSECLRSMFSWQGHFDDGMMAAFVKCVGIYPVGSLVLLESGLLSLVVEQPEEDLSRPLVKTFHDTRAQRDLPHMLVQLSASDDRIASRENPRDWGIRDWDVRWPKMMR